MSWFSVDDFPSSRPHKRGFNSHQRPLIFNQITEKKTCQFSILRTFIAKIRKKFEKRVRNDAKILKIFSTSDSRYKIEGSIQRS